MATITRFEDIESWRTARELVKIIYAITSKGSISRDFGLKDQMRRAAVSIMSNIAEGFERNGNKEFIQFLSIAKGSCGELRAQSYVALDQNYITQIEFNELSSKALKTSRMISGLMKYLIDNSTKGMKFKTLTS